MKQFFICECGNYFKIDTEIKLENHKCDCGKMAEPGMLPPSYQFKGSGFYSDTYKADRMKSIEKEIANIKA